MAFRFGISSLTISDGTQFAVPDQGVVVFVGPNNVGKSAALRNVQWLLNRLPPAPGQEPTVVTAAEIAKEGTTDELESWMQEHTIPMQRGHETVFKRPGGAEMPWPQMRYQWHEDDALSNIMPMMTFTAAAEGRLGLASSSSNYDPMRETPSTPLQVMVFRPELEELLSAASREAFDVGLTLNRVGGSQISPSRWHNGCGTNPSCDTCVYGRPASPTPRSGPGRRNAQLHWLDACAHGGPLPLSSS